MFVNRLLIGFARGNFGKVACACLLEMVVTLTSIAIALCSSAVVSLLLGAEPILPAASPVAPLLAIGVLACVRYVLAGAKARVANEASGAIKEALRKRMLDKVFELGPAFASGERTGDVADAISNKVEWLSNYYVIYLPACVGAILSSAITIAVLGAFDVPTAVVCTVFVLLVFACPMTFYRLMRGRGEAEWAMHSAYYSDCLDSIQGIVALKSFNANRQRAAYIKARGEELRRGVMAHLRVTMTETALLELLVRLGSAATLVLAALRCLRGELATDQLVVVLFLSGACFSPLSNLGNAWHMGYRGVTATYSIERLLEARSQVPLPARVRQGRAPREAQVAFEGVSFAYDADEGPVLSDVTLEVPEHSMVALVGPSGSGKSTIAHLLAGFYLAQEGSVSAGGVTLTQETLREVRPMLSAVWQDSHVFYGTLAENIAMGREGATRGEVEQAAREASLYELASGLEHGFDTHLGEGGMRLSGGERQRLVIARAILRDAPILIFDEVTSSLDRKNEIAVQRSFERLRADKTVLVIAHRLSTIRSADIICVVEGGRIVAAGTHDELLATSPRYQELMGAQEACAERGEKTDG